LVDEAARPIKNRTAFEMIQAHRTFAEVDKKLVLRKEG
jgi:hypothetical protein